MSINLGIRSTATGLTPMEFLDAQRHIPKPGFLVIGPGRCGTSWLHAVLGEHSDICVSSTKETSYFDMEFDRGPEWYAQFFIHYAGQARVGEVATTYIASSMAADRIASFNPSMQIISPVRDPVARTFSHYLRSKRNGQPVASFEEALESRPVLLQRSRYAAMLEPYLDRFPAQQLRILIFEDLLRDASAYCRSVYGFLQVDQAFMPPSLHIRVEPAAKPVNEGAARLAKQLSWRMRRIGLAKAVYVLKRSFVAKRMYKAYAPEDYPKLHRQTRRRLVDYFHEDALRLSKIVGRDLPSLWWPDLV